MADTGSTTTNTSITTSSTTDKATKSLSFHDDASNTRLKCFCFTLTLFLENKDIINTFNGCLLFFQINK